MICLHSLTHLLCPLTRRDLHSLRDLNASHLPLLRNILNTLKPSAELKVGGGVLYEKFKVWASRVCIFVEYLPRFYRLHFRVTQYENRYSLPLFADQVKDDLAPHEKERSYHLLEDIIENIEMMNDYYQRKSLLYQLDRFDELHFRLCEYRWFGKRTEQRLASCDFHCHSVHSDGRLTVEEIMEKAHRNGLKIFSLTDHDNMAGVAKAIELGKHYGIEVIPGVEISTETESGENVHVLGYFPLSMSTEDNAQLQEQLEQIREARYTRGKEMLKRLAELNIHLEWNRILELAGEAAPGRPHVADALVEKGYVADFRAAFDKYLGQDKPAFVQGRRFPPEEAVALIRRLSGFSVLAHPWCCKAPQNLIRTLAANGLQGMEVYTGNLTLREEFSRLADEHSLVKMGGSDFHGRDDEENRLGNLPIPDEVGRWMLTCAKESGWPTKV